MSERQPWPMGYRDETDKPPTPDSSVAAILEYLESCGESVWRCHELDRSDAEGQPVFEATAANLAPFAAETLMRLGYDSARRFVAAVHRDDSIDDEHAALIANVRRRFGDLGLQRFAFALEMNCDGLDADIAEVEGGSQ